MAQLSRLFLQVFRYRSAARCVDEVLCIRLYMQVAHAPFRSYQYCFLTSLSLCHGCTCSMHGAMAQQAFAQAQKQFINMDQIL